MNFKRSIAAIMAAICIASAASVTSSAKEISDMNQPTNIVIDGNNANTAENMLYRGAGMVSGNNSSRLLMDYKSENPERYWEILSYIFGEDGIGVNHLKLEMGSDINSSSGTEPSVKRSADESADVTRGAGYMLACDAKTINPDLTLDMLWWGEPKWISDSEDVYAARYRWYKETLDAAYETYNLKFDYVSAVQNERAIDVEWIKYLSKALKAEKNCPYDYSKIKIAAADEVCSWGIADKMLRDDELMQAIDVVGSHYTSRSTNNAQKLAYEYGKELWFSEGSTPMTYAQGTYRFDEGNSGLTGINGVLDVANRFIMMYPNGRMTLCQYQPIVAAYYDGVCYCQKQFINACDPWSGYYTLDSGFYMSRHFSQFIKKGWAFIDGACYSDGNNGGDGHAIVDSVYSYITAADTETGDYSTVITNTTAEPITYSFTVSNLKKQSSAVDVWETRGPDGTQYDENYFKRIETITPKESGGKYIYSVTVKPYSMVTVSTVGGIKAECASPNESERGILALPYADDFEYKDYPEDYLEKRGYAPRYTTDEGGAFEVTSIDGNNVLKQMITPETKANEWGWTPDPVTNLGDDRWYNYSVSIDVTFAESEARDSNYAGVGLRYNSGYAGLSGYWLQLFESGKYQLWLNNKTLDGGSLEAFVPSSWTELKIEAVENRVRCYVNGKLVIDYIADETEPIQSAGRASLFSSYNQNCFDNLKVKPVKGVDPYITRRDNTDLCCDYSGSWTHTTMGSYKSYKRTSAKGVPGACLTIDFDGTGFAIAGETEAAVISVEVDGELMDESRLIENAGQREITYYLNGLQNGTHKAKITVLKGSLSIDSVELRGGELQITKVKSKVSAEKLLIAAVIGAAALVTAIVLIKRKRKNRQ